MKDRQSPLKLMLEAERVAFSLLRTEVEKEKIAVRKAKSAFAELKAGIADDKAEIKDLKSRPPGFVRRVPILGMSRVKQHEADLEALRRRQRMKERSLKDLRKKDSFRRSRMQSYRENARWLHARVKFTKENPALADDELARIAGRLHFRMSRIQSSNGFKKGPEVLAALEEERPDIERWHDDAEARLANMWTREKRAPTKSGSDAATEALSLGKQKQKIYLPMNRMHGNKMRDRGFRIDETVRKGSQIYFDPSEDMELVKRWQQSLPTAARRHKRQYSFLEIAEAARGQNVRKAFKDDFWDTIRFDLNLMTGSRCVICGNRGGRLITDYFRGEKHKSDSVECHEVWEWSVLDEERGIGVQKLKDILVLCSDCHMMFHEDFAVEKAVKNGKNGAEVREFLRSRMALVTGQSRPELEQQLSNESAELARMDGIETWIMDLQYLSDHAYLSKTTPEFNDGSDNPVPPTMIGGTEFIDPDGTLHEAQEVEALYYELVRDLEDTLAVGMNG